MWKVFVTERIPEPGLEMLREKCEVEVNPEDRVLTKEEIIEGVKEKTPSSASSQMTLTRRSWMPTPT